MPWDMLVPTGGGTGGGEMVVHGPEWHNADVPSKINPNLLYNSTGMMNMNGWIIHPKVINFRDEFIIDDFSYFLATGNSADGNAMISASTPLIPGQTYTFSGQFVGGPIRVSMLFQDQANVNLIDYFVGTTVLFEETFLPGSPRRAASFVPPAGTYAGSLKIEFLAATESDTAKYMRMKIEEGNKATEWIPCLTDPYQNNIVISGVTAADLA